MKKYEYKIMDNRQNKYDTEVELFVLSEDGWRVIGFTQYQILLEREVVDNENSGQGMLFD